MIWKTIFSKPPTGTDIRFGPEATPWPLVVVRHPQAKQMKLQLDSRRQCVRLTLPKRAPESPALRWVETKRDWIAAQIARQGAGAPIGPGARIPYRDSALELRWQADWPRTVRQEGDALLVGGPQEGVEGRVIRWLKREALSILDAETRALAERVDRIVDSVGVGDPARRWGSCSSKGGIRYSWRLILAPDHVRQMIVAHEVAHLVHMNHSPAFHALAKELSGEDPRRANRWLRTNGQQLHGFGARS